jgi:hypothetical protein
MSPVTGKIVALDGSDPSAGNGILTSCGKAESVA